MYDVALTRKSNPLVGVEVAGWISHNLREQFVKYSSIHPKNHCYRYRTTEIRTDISKKCSVENFTAFPSEVDRGKNQN